MSALPDPTPLLPSIEQIWVWGGMIGGGACVVRIAERAGYRSAWAVPCAGLAILPAMVLGMFLGPFAWSIYGGLRANRESEVGR